MGLPCLPMVARAVSTAFRCMSRKSVSLMYRSCAAVVTLDVGVRRISSTLPVCLNLSLRALMVDDSYGKILATCGQNMHQILAIKQLHAVMWKNVSNNDFLNEVQLLKIRTFLTDSNIPTALERSAMSCDPFQLFSECRWLHNGFYQWQHVQIHCVTY